MLRIIPQSEFVEGRWRNGQGVSWEIASHKKAGAADFSWRFAKARIDSDVPFSIYPGMDRIFMMLEGDGMDLEFEGGKFLHVHEKFVPHEFSCDVPLNCKLRGGPSIDLNLFAARDDLKVAAQVLQINEEHQFKAIGSTCVFYALDNDIILNGAHLKKGDAAVAENAVDVVCHAKSAKLFIGTLQQ
jgi:environmental stress-induced protein Ves